MKTILSIDFDIIMEPSIDLYNHMAPGKPWEEMFSQYPGANCFMAEFYSYKILMNIIFNLTKTIKQDNIIITEDHSKIVEFFPNEKINLINIDHHHDIGYGEDIDIPEITCSNWVHHLYTNNRLNNYVWVNNYNSEPAHQNEYIINDIIPIKEFDIKNFPKIDMLCLTLSQPWMPLYYNPLFDTIIDLLSIYYNTQFEPILGGYNNEKNIDD